MDAGMSEDRVNTAVQVNSALQRLIDEKAIVDVTIAYCWAIDNHQWDILRNDVFLPDATAGLGSELTGVESIVSRINAALGKLDASQHMVSNHQISIDGDTATCRCYLQAQHIRKAADGGPNYIVAGIYADRFVRTSSAVGGSADAT
jgi:SnoaL-like domain